MQPISPSERPVSSIHQLAFSLADGTIVPAQANSQIEVLGLQMSADDSIVVIFKSDSEQIMGYCLAASGGLVAQMSDQVPLFATNISEALVIDVTGTPTNGFGYLQYIRRP